MGYRMKGFSGFNMLKLDKITKKRREKEIKTWKEIGQVVKDVRKSNWEQKIKTDYELYK